MAERTVQISKSNGQPFLEGIHSMCIESEVSAYPRAYSRPQRLKSYPTSSIRLASGIPKLDDGDLLALSESPLGLQTGAHFANVFNLIERENIKIVVFDSAGVYATQNVSEVVEFLYAFANYLKQNPIATYLSFESPEKVGISQISETLKAPHLVGSIVILSYEGISTKLRRATDEESKTGKAA